MTDQPTDSIYANPLTEINRFSFDEQVVRVFPDMIKRSVPGYMTILSMIGDMAERYAQADSHCYDLGCSLGAATLAMRHRIKAANCKIIGVDNAKAMIKQCQSVIDADSNETPVELRCNNIESTNIENASIVVLNFTLQFIDPSQRESIIQNIYDGLNPGGILLLSEKIIFEDEPHQQLMTDLYHNFKRTNGYSSLEIAQKRTALENVLQPETIKIHKNRMKSAGFTSADVWFQCFTFASFIAIKV
ncbi:MAG: carboxy-S-adenosyl-L-methionine synthase CmoA [Cellvibrionaceae bacterium]